MTTTVNIDNYSGEEAPEPDSMRRWANSAIGAHMEQAELSIRIVTERECAELNTRYRDKQGPTNVLAFAADLPDFVPVPLLGDIVICASVVIKEAKAQGKQVQAHWAHMVIHGTLHLLGYDHGNEADAQVMETLETELLTALGFPPPYTASPRSGAPPTLDVSDSNVATPRQTNHHDETQAQ